jgi:mediator of RNA polymerase II transcription subunit 24
MDDTPILDFMDTKCACNTIECLLTEMKKQNLVNDKHIKHYSAKREATTQSLQKLDRQSPQQSIVKYVIRVEPPMTGILKTLSKDYNHVQEALLGMLCQVLSGKKIEQQQNRKISCFSPTRQQLSANLIGGYRRRQTKNICSTFD